MTFTLFRDTDSPKVEKDISADIVAGTPRHHAQLMYNGNQETIKSGVWESTAGTFRAVMQDQVEFCHILEGSASIRTDQGDTFEVTAGDAFVMENGLGTEWTVAEHVKKHFVICSV